MFTIEKKYYFPKMLKIDTFSSRKTAELIHSLRKKNRSFEEFAWKTHDRFAAEGYSRKVEVFHEPVDSRLI